MDIIFYGDSIFWEFKGDNLITAPTEEDLQRRAIFEQTFKDYSYEIMAIPGTCLRPTDFHTVTHLYACCMWLCTCPSWTVEWAEPVIIKPCLRSLAPVLSRVVMGAGDQSGNLQWRIETGGEFPTVHMPHTVVILIGTNDLTFADCHEDQPEILAAAPGIISRHDCQTLCCVPCTVQHRAVEGFTYPDCREG